MTLGYQDSVLSSLGAGLDPRGTAETGKLTTWFARLVYKDASGLAR
jgi:hypothetical protein